MIRGCHRRLPPPLGLIGTALVLGIRHGFDWDHLAAITDVTSTTATAEHAELHHETDHDTPRARARARARRAGRAARHTRRDRRRSTHHRDAGKPRLADEQRRAMLLGSLYALGHAAVVAVLGLLALLFGALLPDWVDDGHGPGRRRDARLPRDLGLRLALPVRPPRPRVPAPQPVDARLRLGRATRGAGSRRGSTATSTSTRWRCRRTAPEPRSASG